MVTAKKEVLIYDKIRINGEFFHENNHIQIKKF